MSLQLHSKTLGRAQLVARQAASTVSPPAGRSLRAAARPLSARALGLARARPSAARWSPQVARPSQVRTFFWRSSSAAAPPPADVKAEAVAAAGGPGSAATATTTTTTTQTATPATTATTTTTTTAPTDAAAAAAGYEIPEVPASGLPEAAALPSTVDIGTLKSLGMDYSVLNPAYYLEWLLEHVHVYSGMPWWGSIIATVLLVRVGLVKVILNNNEVLTRISILAPVTKPLSAEVAKATKEQNLELATAKRAELLAINRQMGTTIKDMARFPVIQGLVGFGTFKLLRDMAAIPAPGLETGGFLWLTDLSVSDPYYILPLTQFALMATTMTLIRERSPATTTMTANTSRMIALGTATLMSGFSAFMPAGLQIAFFASALFQQSTNMALTFGGVRKTLGLSPLAGAGPTQPAAAAAGAAGLGGKLTLAAWQQGGPGGLSRKKPAEEEQPKSFVRSLLDQVDDRMKDLGYSKTDDPRARAKRRGKEREREWYEQYKKERARG